MKKSAIEQIVVGFHQKTLPLKQWTHQAHLIVGLDTILKHGVEHSIPVMRQGIKAYNLSVGTQNTDSSGYHESITIFFLHALQAFREKYSDLKTLPELIPQLDQSQLMAQSFMFHFYKKETLFSIQARRHWVAPDIRPLSNLHDINL